jgi:hypothetical protein
MIIGQLKSKTQKDPKQRPKKKLQVYNQGYKAQLISRESTTVLVIISPP